MKNKNDIVLKSTLVCYLLIAEYIKSYKSLHDKSTNINILYDSVKTVQCFKHISYIQPLL